MMREVNRGFTLLAVLLAMMGSCAKPAMAQVPTTTVQDTVYTATGAPAGGSVVVTWGAFTLANGDVIPPGSTSATLGAGGALSLALAPNEGATPLGSYYTAVFHLSDGTTSKQYWVIPVTVPGGGPAKLAGIENSVLPTSVAMQTVSKAYVDTSIARAQLGGLPLDASSPYVLSAGDTMTGPLVLPGDPVSPLQAADKHYVDVNVASITGGLGQTVKTLPAATQVVSQPSGTQLDVNNLNGELYASQYVNVNGTAGIANAVSSADCGANCKVVVEPGYDAGEPLTLGAVQSGLVVDDQRGGSEQLTAVNPLAPSSAFSAAHGVTQYATMSQQQLQASRPGAQAIGVAAEELTTVGLTGGTNLFPAQMEAPPNFKSTYGVLSLKGIYNTQGQHIQLNSDVYCYGVGDCLAGGQFITSSGGYRDNSDEGAHPYDLLVTEDTNAFAGTCASNCAAGMTTIGVTPTRAGGTQGDGRFLIDTAPGKVISGTTLVGGGRTIFGTANFAGTKFPVSVLLSTAAVVTSQASNVAPGTVTLPIAPTALVAGFATNTAALPATSGVACIADAETGTQFPDYEMASYRVVDATHLQMTLNKPHEAGAVIAVGGLCGYGIEQTVDDAGAIRQVFPVVGSYDGTDLYYADALTTVIGSPKGAASTSGYLNVSGTVASIARSANVVTVTTSNGLPDVNGLTLTMSGVADPSYNGSFVVTSTGPNSFTYANAGANSTSTGGTAGLVTGGFNLYPMAEVLSVYDPVTHAVDGTFTLAANTVNWAAGDTVEEPHYHQQNTSADTEIVTQYVPRPIQYVQAGKTYTGNVSAGVRGWEIINGNPGSYYLGGGGTHNLPDDAYVVNGAWRNDFEVQAGTGSVIYAHCNAVTGCSRWDSGYDLFQLDSAVGTDLLRYEPESSSVNWVLQGTPYSFSPSAFTAPTINVGTLNATTINGGVSGSAITTGTVSAARLPVFGPSGTTHAAGIVPDPGATAGATRYLREDGLWSTPAGGGGGGGGSPTGAAGGDLAGSYPNPTVAAVHATSGTLDGVTAGATTPLPAVTTQQLTVSNPSSTALVVAAFTMPSLTTGQLVAMGFGTTIGSGHSVFFAWHNTVNPYGSFETFAGSAPAQLLGSQIWLNGGPVFVGNSNATGGATLPSGGLFNVGTTNQMSVGSDGGTTLPYQLGPSAAPVGACAVSGAWVFSQDGHATFCASGTWVSKI